MKATLFHELLSPIRQQSHAFFKRRSPKSDHVSLGLSNVYVFFSRQGFLFGLLLVITFIMGVNYGNNLVLGLCFYLFGIWLVAVFYTFVQVSSLEFKLIKTHLTQAGDMAWVDVEISTKSGQPSRQVCLSFDGGEPVVVSSLSKETVSLSVPTNERGVMSLPRLTVQSVYPLGVLRAWAYVYFDSPVYVYPKAYPFDYQKNIFSHQANGGQIGVMGRVGQDDFDRLDSYQMGESLARVSWGHLARGAGMLTKHFADPVGIHRQVAYDDMPSSHHEQKLSEMVFVLHAMQDNELAFYFILPNTPAQFGSGQAFVQECLLKLAKTP
ncbi:MAG: hypothetical protein Q3971_08465 [Moraxella sp.]|nr:hypothetical protein [Moraxella sp.]